MEITPNQHISKSVSKKKPFYFEFHAEEPVKNQKNGNIVLYLKTTSDSEVYLIKNDSQLNLSRPGPQSYQWMTSTGNVGGLASIEIKPSDPEYCINCNYMGVVLSKDSSQIDLMVAVEHNNLPIPLYLHTQFPCFL